MDPVILCCIAIIIVLFSLVSLKVYKLVRPTTQNEDPAQQPQQQQRQRAPLIVGGRRQIAVRRRAGAAAAGAQRRRDEDDDEDDSADDGQEDSPENWQDDLALPDGKVGKKKLAKLQAKAEKRAQRESEIEDREERRKREAEKEERRRKEEEKEKKEEQAREEEERKAKEEKERQEYEEYLKMKEAFEVEEEGFDQVEAEEAENLLQEFVDYVKKTKVVNMEELADHFKLRPQDVVDRIKTLVSEGTLTGVIDDRGKFIYITVDELKAVAKFINQRGRVSVSELADYSNKLIRLEPEDQTVA